MTYAVVSGPATIAGNIVTLTGAGTVMLLANQAASGNYAAATATTSFIVAAAPAGFTLTASRLQRWDGAAGWSGSIQPDVWRLIPGQPIPIR